MPSKLLSQIVGEISHDDDETVVFEVPVTFPETWGVYFPRKRARIWFFFFLLFLIYLIRFLDTDSALSRLILLHNQSKATRLRRYNMMAFIVPSYCLKTNGINQVAVDHDLKITLHPDLKVCPFEEPWWHTTMFYDVALSATHARKAKSKILLNVRVGRLCE
jgi:hypothetical protein